jgi:hypothetical protein
MEGDSTTLREMKHEMDESIAVVMPDSWEGHARIAIRESDDIPTSIEQSAIKRAVELADKKNAQPERVANKLISTLVEKQE